MFGQQKPADAYHAAVKRLAAAEDVHRQNLERLAEAREARQVQHVTRLRKGCEATERELQAALKAAHEAHRAYWTDRLEAARADLHQLAVVAAAYNAIAKLAGDRTTNPALQFLQQEAIGGVHAGALLGSGALADEGAVPEECPDCALLEDVLGAWRP